MRSEESLSKENETPERIYSIDEFREKGAMFVPVSSNIECVTYLPEARMMLIDFKFGGGTNGYVYFGVDIETWSRFLDAESAGKFFHANIREKFVTKKVLRDKEGKEDIES